MTKHIYITIFFLVLLLAAKAQVGIGTNDPDTNSVLDLTNPKNGGLLLPAATSFSQMSSEDRILYYFDNNIYVKQSNGYNIISPWKFRFNGNTTNDVFLNLGGFVGIGNNDTLSPQAPLYIESAETVSLSDNGILEIGTSVDVNMAISGSEIQTRDRASASPMKINEDGGDITFGSAATKTDVTVIGNLQEIHHPTNTNYDLVPTGMIIMWYGDASDIPIGWVICDGGIYQRSDDVSNIMTPDLSGRFVIAAGDNGDKNYPAASSGGADSVTLIADELPIHNHNVRAGSHSHTYSYTWAAFGDGDNANDRDYVDQYSLYNDYSDIGYIPVEEDFIGGGKAHENRPIFYSLVYIMKL